MQYMHTRRDRSVFDGILRSVVTMGHYDAHCRCHLTLLPNPGPQPPTSTRTLACLPRATSRNQHRRATRIGDESHTPTNSARPGTLCCGLRLRRVVVAVYIVTSGAKCSAAKLTQNVVRRTPNQEQNPVRSQDTMHYFRDTCHSQVCARSFCVRSRPVRVVVPLRGVA